MNDREKMVWFETNYCLQCPRFVRPSGEICPRCPNTEAADIALAAVLEGLIKDKAAGAQ